ncbi:transposase [Paraburkholderia elongata]|nr:transposase [Paraburkholderia elongata]
MDMQTIWSHKVPVPTRTKGQAVTRFHDWDIVNAAEYLQLAGLDTGIAGGHTIYAFTYGGLRFLVPAILVMKALFRPHATAFENLYRRSALDLMLAPVPAAGTMTAHLVRKSRKYNKNPQSKRASIGYRWLYCFPSAREAWDSVYQSAVQGRIHVTMPKIQASIATKGLRVGDTLLVSNLTILSFESMETPFAWAGEQPRQFDFGLERKDTAPYSPLIRSDLKQGPDGWALSDDEWNSIEHLFPHGFRRNSGEQARTLISAVLFKLGTGIGWKAMNARLGTTARVSSFYRDCRRFNRWDEVERILRGLRK